MDTILLLLAVIFLISAFGIHAIVAQRWFDPLRRPFYLDNPILSAIPIISGFILPVFVWSILLGYHWIVLFLGNGVIAIVFGMWLGKGYLVRFASGKGYGFDMIYALIAGIITLTIGILIR